MFNRVTTRPFIARRLALEFRERKLEAISRERINHLAIKLPGV